MEYNIGIGLNTHLAERGKYHLSQICTRVVERLVKPILFFQGYREIFKSSGKSTRKDHLRKKRDSSEIIMLIMIIVVIGIYIFRLGRSITISPGSRPMGILPIQGQSRPMIKNIMPIPIRVFCICSFAI